jgi:RNA polymerase sigma factor (sigma-70 family)
MLNHTTELLRTVRQAAGEPDDAVPDRELLRRFATDRDESAFTALVRRYSSMVLGVGLRALHHRQDAEDVCQATFLTLARKAATVGWRESVAGWLYDAARRHASNVRAAAARRVRRPADPAVRVEPDPATGAALRELRAALDEELARLPEKLRTPLVLCCLEGMTRDEVAACLGVPLSTVKSRLEEGRERLRRRLTRRGLELAAVLGSYTVLTPAGRAAAVTALVRTITPGPAAAGAVAFGAGASRVGWAAVASLGGLLVAGALASGLFAPSPGDPPKPAARAADPRLDRHGDPLPAGAVLRLGTTRLRHANVFSLAFTADGKLASFGQDNSVKVWDPASGRLVSERAVGGEVFHSHWGGRLSPDGRLLVVQRGDVLKVYDAGSGKELATVQLAGPWAVAQFSPDGKSLAFADQDRRGNANKLQLYDLATNTTREISRISGYFSDPVFSRDGSRLAMSEGSAGGVGVWEVATSRELFRFKPEGLIGGTVDFDPTGDVLAVLGAVNPPQAFHYVRISTGKPPDGWPKPAVADFGWVRFAPDGESIVFGGRKGLVCYERKSAKQLYDADGWAATPPARSPDGKLLASARQNAVLLLDAKTGRPAVPEALAGSPEEELQGVSVSPDGKWILAKSFDSGTIHVWDSDGRPKGDIPSNRSGGRYPLFGPDGRHLFGVTANALALARWEFPGGKESARYVFEHPADQVYVYHYGLSADGTRLAAITQTVNRPGGPAAGVGGAGGRSGEVATFTVWDVATARRVESREVDSPGLVGYGAFSPDLRWYAHGDRAFAVAGGPEFRFEMPARWESAWQGAASPDGRLVAQLIHLPRADTPDYRLLVHETATGKPLFTLTSAYCGPIAFTPDGRGLVVTDAEGVTLWDLAARKPVVRHKPPGRFKGSFGGSFASSLVVTPDGTRAVTGQSDTTALVWDLRTPARQVKKLAGADLAAAWADLAGADAGKAYAAVWALADGGADVVPFLADRVKPTEAPDEARVRKLVARLDADEFADRETAERDLRGLGDVAAPAIREVAKGGLSAEQSRRVSAVLAAADVPVLAPGDRVRAVRAVAVLERVETPDARALLGRLAKGAPGSRLTREAADALRRPTR